MAADFNATQVTANGGIALDYSSHFNLLNDLVERIAIATESVAISSQSIATSSQSIATSQVTIATNTTAIKNSLSAIESDIDTIKNEIITIDNHLDNISDRGTDLNKGFVFRSYNDPDSLNSKQQRAVIVSALKKSESLPDVVNEIRNPTPLPTGE
jgi:predicted  nucleic acid-binding Zn-ribbon protein